MNIFNKFYDFELSLGSQCNFRCNYCFAPPPPDGFTNDDVTPEQLQRYADYIKYVISKGDPSYVYGVCIYGGETLIYFDKLYPFFKALKKSIIEFTIITNGALIRQKLPLLLECRRLLGDKISFIVSYDFCHQNQSRQADTYQLVRDNIKLLANRGFRVVCLTVFDGETLPFIWERFEDFLQLKKDIPKLVTKFNLSRNVDSFSSMNEHDARISLSKVRDYMEEHPELHSSFIYNPSFMYRCNRLEGAFFGNVLMGMSLGGGIYPGYDVPFMHEFARKSLYLGNIMEEFDVLDARKEEMMKILPFEIPDVCKDCDAICRVLPWSRMTNSLNQYNMTPDEEHCYIHKLVSEYITWRRDV